MKMSSPQVALEVRLDTEMRWSLWDVNLGQGDTSQPRVLSWARRRLPAPLLGDRWSLPHKSDRC